MIFYIEQFSFLNTYKLIYIIKLSFSFEDKDKECDNHKDTSLGAFKGRTNNKQLLYLKKGLS